MKKQIIALSLLALFSAGTARLAEANLIVNGSFEDPDLINGQWGVYDAIPGWTKIGDVAGIEIQNNAAGAAYDGEQLVELDSHSNSAMQQIISTVLGEHYTLSFAYSPRPMQPGTTNAIEVRWGGTLLTSLSGTGGNLTSWTVYNFDVIGKGLNTSLAFYATSTSDSYGGYLDAVSLNANPVPEPATLLLFGTGIAGLAGLRLRKKKVVS